MAYTPAKIKDDPIEGCPRITEEEFTSLKEAGEAISKAKSNFARINDNILTRYGRKQIEEIGENGTIKAFSMIQGHNIITCQGIY